MRWLPSLVAFLLALSSPVLSQTKSNSELVKSGQQLLDEGQFEKAVATLTAALKQQGDTALVRSLLGRAYYEQRNFDQAAKQFERAVKQEPRNSMAHLWLGRAYGRKAEHAFWFSAISLAGKTRREFETAVQLDPQNLEARHDLLEFYLDAPGFLGGGRDKARAEAQEITERDPVEGHRAWASYWLKEKQYDKAEAEIKKAIEGKPRRPDVYFDLIEFYRERGRFRDMEPVARLVLETFPTDHRVPYYVALADVLNNMQLDEAQKLLEQYLAGAVGTEDPSRAQARLWLGRLYELQNQPAKAEAEYVAALQLEPDLKEAKEALNQLRKKK